MGGAAPTPSGKGGKKPLDASINLVPFIDLLSCCISFLLITAVWTQLARMDVTQKSKAPSGITPDTPPEPQINLTVNVGKTGYSVDASNGDKRTIDLKGEDYDYTKLAETLAAMRKDHNIPEDKKDITVACDDTVI
jgi:biopolymer transport protein ExbD